DTAIPADARERMTHLLIDRLKADSDAAARGAEEMVDPTLAAQELRTADGKSRFYVSAMWPFTQSPGRAAYKLAGWFATKPAVQLFAAETCSCEIDTPQLPRLLNVVDLG